MRQPRLKVRGREVFHHVFNRVAGDPTYMPFGDREKEQFLRLLKKLETLYAIEVIACTVMSNHFHLILFAPANAPSDEETSRRFVAYYGPRRRLNPGTPDCRAAAERLRDISCFMHDLQHQFTCWFNRTRTVRRRGALWAGRFGSALLEAGMAVWSCWQYTELNPVRAGLVAIPSAYRFSTWGIWNRTGSYPFERALEDRLLPKLRDWLGVATLAHLRARLRKALEEESDRVQRQASAPACVSPGDPLPFIGAPRCPSRQWRNGRIVGSRAFVAEIMRSRHPCTRGGPDRWTVSLDAGPDGKSLVNALLVRRTQGRRE